MDQNSFSGGDPVSPTPPSLMSEPRTVLLPAPKRHLVRWIVVIVLLAIVFVLLYMFRGVFVAATLDGKPISRLAIVRRLEQQSGAQVLDALVNQSLIEKKAAEAGIVVGGEDIEKAIAEIRENLASQNTTLEDALQAQNVTRAQLEENIRFQKLAEKLIEDRVAVSEEEINTFMEQQKEFLPQANSAEEQRNMIRDMLRQQKFSSAFSEWLSAAKAEADISYWKKY